MDQENVAGAGDALLDRFAGREGRMVEDEAEAFPPHGSPPSMSEVPVLPPLLESRPFDTGGPPKLMNSFRVVALVLLAPSSCSFRVCSCSTRAEVDLIKFMYAWNCVRLSRGPKLNCHRMGRMSRAKKSPST